VGADVRHLPFGPADYERWRAQPETERLPFLLPLDRTKLPPHLDGELVHAWVRALRGERVAEVREYDEHGEEIL